MELTLDDLPYFVAFVLLDEARRLPSGKRQRQPMKGVWMAGQMKAGLRLSDRRFRQSVCIQALRAIGGKSVTEAAAYVAAVAGKTTAAEVTVLRVGYYECRPGLLSWNLFRTQFLHWRAWVFASDEALLKRTLDDYGRRFDQRRVQSLADLTNRLRRDPVQRTRNRCFLLEPGEAARTRLESNHWDPESDWQMLATDVWTLARLHASIGEGDEARALLNRALTIWKTHGHELADVQAEAISALDREIGRLTGVPTR